MSTVTGAVTTDPAGGPSATPPSSRLGGYWQRLLSGSWVPIVVATIVLFLVSPLVAPGSLGPTLLTMLPIAGVLALVSAGQTLVVQQRGLDMSIPGMVALAASLSTALPSFYGWPLWLGVLFGIVMPGVVGLVNGAIITYLRVMPIVVTLGMNSVLLGVVFFVNSGTPAGSPDELNRFAILNIFGFIPSIFLIAAVVVVIAGIASRKTIPGRRLGYVGVSLPASAALGIRVNRYAMLAYALAGVAYGIGGVLYAGFVKTPPLFPGDQFLLPSVAAVVLGGTALTGGVASIVATGVGALFLQQLTQLLRSLGWQDAPQYIAMAAVLIAVVLIRELVPQLWRWIRSRQAGRQRVAAV